MCNCRKDLQEDKDGLAAAYVARKHKGATIKSAELVEYAFPFVQRKDGSKTLLCVTTTTLRVETNERKRPVDITILHTYCPFCGEKYLKEDA